MLDDRLLEMTFRLPENQQTNEISLFGILYHYKLVGPAQPGDLVQIVAVTPLTLIVRKRSAILDY